MCRQQSRAAWQVTLLIAGLLIACEGVQGYQVRVVNRAPVTVLYYVADASDTKHPGVRLEPGSFQRNQWTYPRPFNEHKLPTVSAFDERGEAVFCRRYTFEQVRDNGYVVEIEAGRIECTPSRQ